MATLRLSDGERLDVLAAAVLDYLNETFSEGELDDDSSPPHTTLYNLASAMDERRLGRPPGSNGHDAHADEQATEAVEWARGEGRLGMVGRRLLENVHPTERTP